MLTVKYNLSPYQMLAFDKCIPFHNSYFDPRLWQIIRKTNPILYKIPKSPNAKTL